MKIPAVGLLLLWSPGIVGSQTEADGPLGKPSAFDLSGTAVSVMIEVGSRIRREPDPCAPTIEIVGAPTELAALARQDDWIQVRHGGWLGWVWDPTTGAPQKCETPRSRPAAATHFADPDHDAATDLDIALETLGEHRMVPGAIALYTDVEDEAVVEKVGQVLEGLPEAYRRRYGLPLDPREEGLHFVLFASERSYREYADRSSAATEFDARGHAGLRTAATFVGEDPEEEVIPTLVHEATHLINRSTLALRLPPWLEEGVATDLEYSRIDDESALELGTVGGVSAFTGEAMRRSATGGFEAVGTMRRTGGRASLSELLEAWRRRDIVDLPVLLELDSTQFVTETTRRIHYSESAFFIRFLLDGPAETDPTRFRSFLRAISDGSEITIDLFEQHMEERLDSVERRFHMWLTTRLLAPS